MSYKKVLTILISTIILIAGLVLIFSISYKPGQPALPTEKIAAKETNIYACDYWRDKTYDPTAEYSDPAGVVKINGKVISRILPEAWAEIPKDNTVLFFEITPPSSKSEKLFYQTYMDIVRKGNSVNLSKDDHLLFKLGVLDDDGLNSTALIDTESKKRIASSLIEGMPIDIILTIPVYVDAGAPNHFTFACKIIAE